MSMKTNHAAMGARLRELRDALEAAFNAGVEQGRKAAKSDKANN